MRDTTFITDGNRKFTALKAPRQLIRRLEAMELGNLRLMWYPKGERG